MNSNFSQRIFYVLLFWKWHITIIALGYPKSELQKAFFEFHFSKCQIFLLEISNRSLLVKLSLFV